MPNKRAAAEALFAASTEGRGVSADNRERIVGALTEDLRAASTQAASVDERLIKIEKRMQVLAEALLAMADMSHASGPAVQAVKDAPKL
jgi:hypothetical protein